MVSLDKAIEGIEVKQAHALKKLNNIGNNNLFQFELLTNILVNRQVTFMPLALRAHVG